VRSRLWAECARRPKDYRRQSSHDGNPEADRTGPGHRGAAGASPRGARFGGRGGLHGLIDQARAVARPKALYAEAFVEGRGDNTVRIGGVTFTSRTLRRKLETVERVFPYVATCGHEMDGVALPAGDILVQYCGMPSRPNCSRRRAPIAGPCYRPVPARADGRMSPGSGDVETWPIEQQRLLFSLLGGVTPYIGVTLTESCLMIPNKTVSGILFPTQEDFQTCQVCHRDPCPNRRRLRRGGLAVAARTLTARRWSSQVTKLPRHFLYGWWH